MVTAPVPRASVTAAFALPDGRGCVTAGKDGTVSSGTSQGQRLQRLTGPTAALDVLSALGGRSLGGGGR